MKRATILVGLAVGLVGAPPAEACPNSYGGDVVAARNMTCSKARDVVRTWAVRHQRDGKYNRRVLGFRCRVETLPHEGYRVTCRRGEKEVSFYPNGPDERHREPHDDGAAALPLHSRYALRSARGLHNPNAEVLQAWGTIWPPVGILVGP